MTEVKKSRLYKTLCKAVRKEDHAELLRMLEMVPRDALRGPSGSGMNSKRLVTAFWWDETPQGQAYWSSLHKSIARVGNEYR